MSDNSNIKPPKTQTLHYCKEAIKDMITGKPVFVFAFMIPLVVMVAIYALRGIFPFGEVCYLRSDMYHQYCPFFAELWEKIRTGGSLEYSWDVGLGSNFIAIYGYYLSSPINWLIAFFPQDWMIEIMNVIILLKTAFASLTCTYYLCAHNKKIHIMSAAFGVFYALSGYLAAYSWNIMWLDCIVLLPLVILGLERLIQEGKGLLYVIALGFTILSNYYIAIMVCVSCVLYFVVIMISQPVNKPVHYVRGTLNFILYSLVAGGLAAAILIPEIYALGYTASGNFNFPDTLDRYFSFVKVISRHLINVEVHTGLDHWPNIYCGVAVLLLFPLYIISKRIPRREKIIKVIVLIVFFTAFNLNIPNFVWHGFHFPNSLPCRQSFIYIFLLLTMCYDAILSIKDTKESHISATFWGVALFLLYLGNSFTDEELTIDSLYTSAIFIAGYALILLIYKSKKAHQSLLVIMAFALMIVECTINMEFTGYSTTNRTYYLRDYDSVSHMLDELEEKDDSFYRISKSQGYRSKNEGSWHNFKSGSTFSSTAYAHITELYGQLGLEHSTNAYAVNGATPLVYSILNHKYLLTSGKLTETPIMTLEDTEDGMYIYRNEYTLPLGFMVPTELKDNWNYATALSPFVVQNNFAELATGVKEIFTPMDISGNTITTTEDGYVFIRIGNTSVKTLRIEYGTTVTSYGGINHGRTVDLGWMPAGTEITFSDADDSIYSFKATAYTMNVDKFIEFYEALADEGLNVTYHDDTHIKGNITALSDGMCFTSIPYDESYTLYVDGVETEFTTIGDALISFPLTAGTHNIELEYNARGLTPGIVITTVCGLIIACCIAFKLVFKKEITEPEALSLLASKCKKTGATSNNEEDNKEEQK